MRLKFFLFLLSLFLFLQEANAATFGQAYIRLNRLASNAALSGLICAQPSSAGAGTEAKVSITFPSDFTINSTASNWTTSTSNLPSGATAWPGIGSNASGVSGQRVTFSGSDLTSTSLYCFNFTGSSSTTGSTGEKTGLITTKNSSDSEIDSSDFGLTIVSSDEITITGTIPPDAHDFQNSLSATAGDVFNQDQNIDYIVTYGLQSQSSTAMTLEVEWYKGRVDGDSTDTVDVLEYRVGSATNGYGSTPPVVDVTNRKVTWTFTSFPGNTTNQTVRLSFRTTSNYRGDKKVGFKVASRILTSLNSSSDSAVTKTYKYSQTSTTPTEVADATIQRIEIREIGKDYATIFIETDGPSTKNIYFGKNIYQLGELRQAKLSKYSLIKLNKLSPDTRYYFKVNTTDKSGNRDSSDIYTFKTAVDKTIAAINLASLVVVSNDIILTLPHTQSETSAPVANLSIPINTNFKFKFSLTNPVSIENIQIVLRNSHVLGAESEALPSTDAIDAIEVSKGIYEGTLKTKLQRGNYNLIARIRDTKGNLIEQKIANLTITNKFTVLSSEGQPIEGARVKLSIYNTDTKIYKLIPSPNLPTGNPLFTTRNGELELAFPQGSYRALVSQIGFVDEERDFTVGNDAKDGLPIIVMHKEAISPITVSRFYLRALNDVFLKQTQSYVLALTGSLRFFDLVAALSLGTLVLLTLFSFSRKHYIVLSSIPSYFLFLLKHKRGSKEYITGVVLGENENPIQGANIYLSDSKNEKILAATQTNKRGEFHFKKLDQKNKYFILAMAKTYKNSPLLRYNDKTNLAISLEKQDEALNIWENMLHLFSSSVGTLFEVLIILSFIFEVVFIYDFGLLKTFPFLAISLFNLLLWSLYLRHRHMGA